MVSFTIKQDPSIFQIINDSIFTKELCLEAVKMYGNNIAYVPDKYMTEELCLIAVKQSGDSITDVPRKYRTKELCLKAIKENGKNFQIIAEFDDEKYITEEMCWEAIKKTPSMVYSIKLNYPSFFKEEMYKEIFKQDINNIIYIPNPKEEMILEAIKEDPFIVYTLIDVLHLKEEMKNKYLDISRKQIKEELLKQIKF